MCAGEQKRVAPNDILADPKRTRQSMRSGDKHLQYKGLAVAIRWEAVDDPAPGDPLFAGSYAITASDGGQAFWHIFPDLFFHTRETAADYALTVARRAIDDGLFS